MSIFFAPIGSGMGDVIVCRPALDFLVQNSSEPVYLVARGPRQVGMSTLFEGLAGEVAELELANHLSDKDRLINLRDHPMQTKENWFSQRFFDKYPGMRIADMLAIICLDFQIAANFKEFTPFNFQFDQRTAGKVALVPGTTMKAKMLDRAIWQKTSALLKDRGLEAIVLGQQAYCSEVQALVGIGLSCVDTTNIQEAVNLVSSASAVISVDTGLMHLAVQQGVPTVAIFGPCQLYYRKASNCLPVFAAAQKLGGQPDQETEQQTYGSTYDTWDWLPPEAHDGDYLSKVEAQRLVELVMDVLRTAGTADKSEPH